MGDDSSDKRTKSFSLKNKNADKIEELAFNEKRHQSEIVDEMVEEYDGTR